MPEFGLGAHVDAADPIAGARERGAAHVQIFLGDPKGWKGADVAYPGGAGALAVAARAAQVELYVHAPYVLNVASTNNRIRIPSRKQLQVQIDAAAEIGAAGIVVHGGHVRAGEDLAVGFDNWRKCIDGLDQRVPVLIENTAGGDGAMARGLERIARLWEAIGAADGGDRVGFCLDTCHAWASGEDLPGLAERITAITGRIDLLHCNDSRDAQGSGADRHAGLGHGTIPEADLVAVVAEAGAPVMLETPGGVDEHRADMAWLRKRLG
ncbi:deoxyribonuclease IV [Pseudactinotalea sp. HY158]|uniref:deoxyribonuclease IV n=1 Tax=Pseudactinotalea sp. HY158 TaxID=2654547 RepID=UPI00129CE13C|nr:deoxyribonuclease IV [Pseudactinotalea sp. HY158]QGH68203.1 deoxyribonuclease IV [Pseudactinotalea sp. HY158]